MIPHKIQFLTHTDYEGSSSSYNAFVYEDKHHAKQLNLCFNNNQRANFDGTNLLEKDYKKLEWDNKTLLRIFNFTRSLGKRKVLKDFLREGGKNDINLIFPSILLNCHTESTIKFIEDSVGLNENLQERHPIKFCFDLLSGWVPEALIHSSNLGLNKSGCDYDYVFRKGSNINHDSDFKFQNKSIELKVDYTNVIKRKDHFHFRYNKFDKLLSSNSFIFIINIQELKYYFYPASTYKDSLEFKFLERVPCFSRGKSVPGYEASGWRGLPSTELTTPNLKNTLSKINDLGQFTNKTKNLIVNKTENLIVSLF